MVLLVGNFLGSLVAICSYKLEFLCGYQSELLKGLSVAINKWVNNWNFYGVIHQ